MKYSGMLVIAILILTGCKKDNGAPEPTPSIKTGLILNQTITISGLSRSYHLFIPGNYSNAPVVFLFHGHSLNNSALIGLNGEKAPYKVWLDLAQQENIILTVPNGLYTSDNEKGWNDCRADAPTNSRADDVLFISSLIDHVVGTYQANASKVFVNGTSNGGHMCIRLAHEIPQKITAFAAIVAANAVNSQCPGSTTPVSALFMNGTADPLLPYNGGDMFGNRGRVVSAQATVEYWVNRNGADANPETRTFPDIHTSDGRNAPSSTVEQLRYRNGRNNTEVVFYKITNGGHADPSIQERTASAGQNGDIEMAREVWTFFKDKSR